jgi:hypothetical protein
MGPLAKPVQQAGLQAIGQRGAPFGIAAADFFEPAERTRGQFGMTIRLTPR